MPLRWPQHRAFLQIVFICASINVCMVVCQNLDSIQGGRQLIQDLYSNFSSPTSQSSSNPVDLIFILDRSASVGRAGWQSMLRFVLNFLEHFTIDEDNTRVAVISYSTTASVDIDDLRNGEHSKCAFVSRFQRKMSVKVPAGYSATNDALLRAKDVVLTSRTHSKKAVFVITDGKSNVGPPPVRASIQLRSLTWDDGWNSTADGPQLQIYAFGIKDAYMPEVRSVASPQANHTFYIPTFQEFTELARSLHDDRQSENWQILSRTEPCNGLCDGNAYCACGTRSGQYLCVCKDGYQGDGMNCSVCPVGTYKNSISPSRCSMCPANSTTMLAGSADVRQCVCQSPYYQDAAGRPCFVRHCSDLPEIPHGHKFQVLGIVSDELPDTNISCQNLPDTSCHFVCEVGYRLDGDPGLVCQANGSWVGRVPTCHIVDCETLSYHQQEPDHASVEYINQTTTYGSVVQAHCHQGWRAFGDPVRTCTHYGLWSGTRTWCVENRCPALLLSPGLIIMPASCGQAAQVPGATCQHVCEVGYQLTGPPQVVCAESGSWDVATPAVCVDREPPSITCPDDVTTPITTANFAVVHWQSHPPLVNDNSGEFTLTKIGVPDSDELLQLTAGYHQIKYIARDRAGNEAWCIQGITVVDFTVHLVSCPAVNVSIHMTSHQQEAVWPEVAFADHNNITTAHRCVPANNTLLPAGIYTVVCVPDTHTYQRVHCQFTAVLRQPTCDMPPPPLHGSVSCAPTATSLLTCRPQCNNNYDFHSLPQGAYICDLDGNWRLRQGGRFWPDCSRKYQPHKAMLHGRAKYAYYGGECEDVKGEIASTFKEFLEHQAWEMCGAETCSVEGVTVACGRDSKRKRRDTGSQRSSRANEPIHRHKIQLVNSRSPFSSLPVHKRTETSFKSTTDSQTSQRTKYSSRELMNNFALWLQTERVTKRSVSNVSSVDDAKLMERNHSIVYGQHEDTALIELNKLTDHPDTQSESTNRESGNNGSDEDEDVITWELYQIDQGKGKRSTDVDLNTTNQTEEQQNVHAENSLEKGTAQCGNCSDDNARYDINNEAKSTNFVQSKVTGQFMLQTETLPRPDEGKVRLTSENDETISNDIEMLIKRSADGLLPDDENRGDSSGSQMNPNGVPSDIDDYDESTNATMLDYGDEMDEPVQVDIAFTLYREIPNHQVGDSEQTELMQSLLDVRDTLGSMLQSHNLTLGVTNETDETAIYNDTSAAASNVLVALQHVLDVPVLDACDFGYVTKVSFYASTQTCVACPAGSYYYMSGDKCLTCPVGDYQPEEAQSRCLSCPDDTITEFPGAHNISMCLAWCEPGQFSGTGLAPCHLCPLHSYQPFDSAASCIPCPTDKKTLTPGAVNVADCLDLCGPGTFSETGLQPCRNCGVGDYQPDHGATECLLCEDGLTTADEGSAIASDCFPWDACVADQVQCSNAGHCTAQNGATTCVCAPGFSGELCEINLPDCLPSSCQNNATCVDGVNAFTCACWPGFTGTQCEVNIDECLSAPCLNGGSCLDVVNGFQCYCPFDYTGARCETQVRLCDGSICIHGTCETSRGVTSCVCRQGFAGNTCNASYDLCSTQPCVMADTCQSAPGQFTCHCLPGFTGHVCDVVLDPCGSSHCSPVSTCIPAPTTDLGYLCKCPGGWSGFFCSQEATADFDLVFNADSPNGQYVTLPREFMPGLQDVSVCAWLRPDPLSAFATIVAFTLPRPTLTFQGNDYVVGNESGEFQTVLTLKHTDKLLVDIFEHSVTTNLSLTFYAWSHLCVTWSSSSSAWRVLINGSLSAQGTVDHVVSAFPADMYVVLGQSNPYYSEGSLTWGVYTGELTQFNIFSRALSLDDVRALAGGVTCNTSFGDVVSWTDVLMYIKGDLEIRETSHCLDINECWWPLEYPCGHHRECVDLIGSYDCSSCTYGYTGSNCDAPDDECAMDLCVRGDCVDGPEPYDYQCVCPAGFTGQYCDAMIDLCVSGPCQNGGSCTPTVNSFSCTCPNKNMGPLCERPASACFPNPCQNRGACLEQENHTFQCQCSNDFSGGLCERRRLWCQDHVCYNGGLCRNHSASGQNTAIAHAPDAAFCECRDGWMGRQCEVRMVLSCELSPCVNGGSCVPNTAGGLGYRCLCKDTAGVGLDENCEFRNPCGLSACANNTLCVSLPNHTFVCVCERGRSCNPSHDERSSNSSYNTGVFLISTEKTSTDLLDGSWSAWWEWASVAVTILCVLLIVFVTSCLLWRRKHKRRSQGEILGHTMDVVRGHLSNPAFHSEELPLEESLYAELGDGYTLPDDDDVNVDNREPHQASHSASSNHHRIIGRNISASLSGSVSAFRSSSSKRSAEADDTSKPLLLDDYLLPVDPDIPRSNEAELLQEDEKNGKRLLTLAGVSNAGFDPSDYVIPDLDMASDSARDVVKGDHAAVENATGSKRVNCVNEHRAENAPTQQENLAGYENADAIFADDTKYGHDRHLLNFDRKIPLAAGNVYANMKSITNRNTRAEPRDQVHNLSQEAREVKNASGYIPVGVLSAEGVELDGQSNAGYVHGNQPITPRSINFVDKRTDTRTRAQQESLQAAEVKPKHSRESYIPFADIWSAGEDNHSGVSSTIQTNTGPAANDTQPPALQPSTVVEPTSRTSKDVSHTVLPSAASAVPRAFQFHNSKVDPIPTPDPTTKEGFRSGSHKPPTATTPTGSSSSSPAPWVTAGSNLPTDILVPSFTDQPSCSLYGIDEQHPSPTEVTPAYLELLPSETAALSHSQLAKSEPGQRPLSLPSKAQQSTSPKALQSTSPQALQSTSPKALQSTSPQALQSTSPKSLQSTSPKALQSTSPQALQSTFPQGLQSTSPKPSQSEGFQTRRASSKTRRTLPDLPKSSQPSSSTNTTLPTKTVSANLPSLPLVFGQLKSAASSPSTSHIGSPERDRDVVMLEDFTPKLTSKEEKRHKEK